MDQDRAYRVSKSLTLQISSRGDLIAQNSVSNRPNSVDADAMPVLFGFAPGRTPREVFALLQEEWEIEEEGFEELVTRLISQNILTPVSGETARESLTPRGFAGLRVHHGMLRDTVRVMSYKTAIERHSAGRHVVEVGCGSGILSIFACKAGARRVTAIEESRISDLAREMFKANGCREVVDLRLGNSRDVKLDEPGDVLVHELLGTDPFAENMLPILADARARLIKPEGRLIPYRLEVCGAGFELEDKPYFDRGRAAAEIRELEGLFGVDFGPFSAAIEASDPSDFPRPLDHVRQPGRFDARILTEEVLLYDIELGDEASGPRPVEDATLKVRSGGTLGGIVVYFRAHLDETTVLTTSPYSVATHWGWDARPFSRLLRVEPGQTVGIQAEVATLAGTQRLRINLS